MAEPGTLRSILIQLETSWHELSLVATDLVGRLTALLREPFLGQPGWMWLAFLAVAVFLLAFDLGIVNRRQRARSASRKPGPVAVLRRCGRGVRRLDLVVDGRAQGPGLPDELPRREEPGTRQCLRHGDDLRSARDRREREQRRVLFWGILGVIVLRVAMIGLGAGAGRPATPGRLTSSRWAWS